MKIRGIFPVVVTVGTVIAGCTGHESIPSGAQQVHVVVTSSEVRLSPATARPGDVYLVLDSPEEGSISFVERMDASGAAGPLTEDDLRRLADGLTEGMSISGLDAGGCDPAQDAAARGQTGPCGNVMKVVLVEGRYAVVGGSLEVDSASGVPPMAVLTVAP